MRIAFQSAAIFVILLVVNVIGQHSDPSMVVGPKDVSDSPPNDPNVADEKNEQRRMLRSLLDTDPRTIIHKSNYGDHTYETLRRLGGGLRFDWTNMYDRTKMTLLAQVIDYYQNPKDACARPLRQNTSVKIQRATVPFSGLGSSLHIWARHLCHAYDRKEVLVVEPLNPKLYDNTDWPWNDRRYCSSHDPPLSCYFGNHESLRSCDFSNEEWDELKRNVPVDDAFRTSWNYNDPNDGCTFIDKNLEMFGRAGAIELPPDMTLRDYNQHIVDDHRSIIQTWNAAAMEYLFQSVKPIVVQEAHRQLLEIFDRGIVPSNLVTVHIRWGDKYKEMELVSIDAYLSATKDIIGIGWDTEPQHIYVATEDPRAVEEFISNMPPNWAVYVSGPTFNDAQNKAPHAQAHQTEGQDGLESLAALLISLEANKYVLTTESNWSRVINELRTNVVDRKCGDCTSMFDVAPGEW